MASVLPTSNGFEYVCEGFDVPQRYDDRPPYKRVLGEAQLRPGGPDVEYPTATLFGLDSNVIKGDHSHRHA